MMSLKHILSALLLVAGAGVFAAGSVKSASALSKEIAAVLKMKEHTPESIDAKPAEAVRQLQYLKGKVSQATALLGVCYKEGFGVAKSLPKARSLFLEAAQKGNAIGQFWAGFFMLRGIGGAQDVPRAVDLLESSAVQGISNAMVVLSQVYLEGYSRNNKVIIQEDHPLALRYLRRAAAGGNKLAAMLLGDWFFKGGMIKNDPVQAREWFVLAVGMPDRETAIAEVDFENGKTNEEKVLAWNKLRQLASAGNARAQAYLGFFHFKNQDDSAALPLAESAMKKGYAPAFRLRALIARRAGERNWMDLMLKAAELGDPEALAAAGFQLATTGKKAKGLDMIRRAERRGVVDGKVKMGRAYLQRLITPAHDEDPADVQAFKRFVSASESGNAEAKYYLSLCYLKGMGCKIDYASAAQLAFEAARSGDSYAQILYAAYLRDGVGVQRNTLAAVRYLEKAANQGNKHAAAMLSDLISKAHDIKGSQIGSGIALVQKSAVDGNAAAAYSLGKMYTEGVKLDRDYNLGRQNLELAAKLNYDPAYVLLAEYYFNGWGVKKDFRKAHSYLAQGKNKGNGDAVAKMGLAKLNGVGVKKDPRAAVRDFELAAAMRSSEGELWLGFAYARGLGGKAVNAETAYRHYKKAAELGNPAGYLMVGLCMRDGIGRAQNGPAALTYLQEAVKLGNTDAMYEIGLLYSNGNIVEKNLDTAVKWFRRAAEAGNSYGIYELACCYENGRGVRKDLAKAAALFRISATAGNRYAQFMIARCYEGGLGVPEDKHEAIRWYRKAASGPDGFKYATQRADELQKKLEEITL